MAREVRDVKHESDWMCHCEPLETEKQPRADSQGEIETLVLNCKDLNLSTTCMSLDVDSFPISR